MVDKVSIANGALALLGGTAIAAWPDPTQINSSSSIDNRSRWAVRLFDAAYDGVLMKWPFAEARGRWAIGRHGEAPAFGWSSQYELDPKVLKVVAARCGGWEREGRRVLADAGDSLQVRTIDRVPEGSIGALLADAVSARLAWRISMALSDSQSKQDARKRDAQDALLEAVQNDNWEGAAEQLVGSGWMLAQQTSYPRELDGDYGADVGGRSAWLDGF